MQNEQNKESNKTMKLLALATQMTSAVLGMSILGYFLDDQLEIDKHYFTMAGALLGVFAGMYLLLNGVNKLND